MTQTLINKVQEAMVKPPDGIEEVVRIIQLMEQPQRVTDVDVRLAAKGWVEIYDDTAGNESVDISAIAYSFYAEGLIKQAIERLTRTERARLNAVKA